MQKGADDPACKEQSSKGTGTETTQKQETHLLENLGKFERIGTLHTYVRLISQSCSGLTHVH